MNAVLFDESVVLEQPVAGRGRNEVKDSSFLITGPSRLQSGTVPSRTRWVMSKANEVIEQETFDFQDLFLNDEALVKLPAVVANPQKLVVQSYSRLLGMWEGYVTSIGDTDFTARLVDLQAGEVDHDAEFDLASVSDYDRDLIQLGAVFYWSISYHHSVTGQVTTSSDLRFRRRPLWTKREIAKAGEKAARFASLLEG